MLTEQRTALLAHLQAHRRAQRAKTDEDIVSAMVRDALIVRAEADLRWLDLCEARLTAPLPNGNSATILLGRDFLLDPELADRIAGLPGVRSAQVAIANPRPLALVG